MMDALLRRTSGIASLANTSTFHREVALRRQDATILWCWSPSIPWAGIISANACALQSSPLAADGHCRRPSTSPLIDMESLAAVLIVAVLLLFAFGKRGRSDDDAPQIDPFFFSQDKDSMDDE